MDVHGIPLEIIYLWLKILSNLLYADLVRGRVYGKLVQWRLVTVLGKAVNQPARKSLNENSKVHLRCEGLARVQIEGTLHLPKTPLFSIPFALLKWCHKCDSSAPDWSPPI